MELIDSIFYRKINPSDFKKMYNIDRPDTGGGQTYLEAAGIDNDDLAEFLGIGELSDSPLRDEQRPIFTIPAYVLGQDGATTKLEFAPRGGRNNYRISRQTLQMKHPAWAVQNGFPEPTRGADGEYESSRTFAGIIDNLIIIILRTSYNRFFASFVNTPTMPDAWPRGYGLESIFTGEKRGVLKLLERGLVFVNDKDTPFREPAVIVEPAPRVTGGANIMLYGVPGSGKSRTISDEYCNDENRMERLVFHPDYTYSDFIGQILPNVSEGNVSYEFTPGPFTLLLKKAYKNPDKQYFLIIEEINRGNAPAIFGEVFQLLDRVDNGESEYGISSADIAMIVYGDATRKVRIPSNMWLIGTMNTSDQNVFTLDTAFQRRWSMRMIENDLGKVTYADMKILDTDISWRRFNTAINSIILQKNVRVTSSEDKRLGAFFVREADLRYDAKEVDAAATPDEKRVAAMQNRRFPEKILKYLWDDAFKFSREDVFETGQYISLEEIVRKFRESQGNARFSVFKEDVFTALLSAEEE